MAVEAETTERNQGDVRETFRIGLASTPVTFHEFQEEISLEDLNRHGLNQA